MKIGTLSCIALSVTFAVAGGCGDNLVPLPDGDVEVGLVQAFRAADVPGCALASPLPVRVQGELQWVIVTSEGHVASYDRDGEQRWSFDLPVEEGRKAEIAATPVALGELVVIAWQVRDDDGGDRYAHQAAVVDAAAGALDARFPIVTLNASLPAGDGSGPVEFLPAHAYSRAALVAGRRAGDAQACADFDPRAPSEACMASCRDLFIPRLRAGDPPLAPENGRCDGLTFLECYAELDLDLGANAPAPVTLPSGRTVIVLPAKDGAVYLFDAAHMGTMLDRLQLRAFCGDNGGNCDGYNWAGTMVTEPLITEVDGAPVALIPTFYFDTTNPGGVVALDVVENGPAVTLRERWSAPERDSDEALMGFRKHTGRLALVELDGVAYAVLADPAEANDRPARLYLIRVADGAIVERAELDGPGQRYQEPAVDGTRVFLNSCESPYATPAGPGHLEAWDVMTIER